MTERSLSFHEVEITSLPGSTSSTSSRKKSRQGDIDNNNRKNKHDAADGSLLGDQLSWSFSSSTIPALERSATLRSKYSLETPSLFASNLTITSGEERDNRDDERSAAAAVDTRRRKLLAFLAGFLSNLVSGLIYAIPLYAQWMTSDLGLGSDGVALLGNLSQAALGLMTLPLGILHTILSNNDHQSNSKRKADLVASLITGASQAGGLALVVIASSPNASLPTPGLTALMATGFILNGGATAGIFSHSMWVSGHNYASSPRLKRVVLVSISLALGLGAFLWVCLFSFLHIRSPWDILLVHAILSAVTAVFRSLFMFRFEEKGEEEEKMKTMNKSKRQQVWKQLGRSLASYFCKSYLTWVFFFNLMIASGLSACILSIIANVLVTALDDDEDSVAAKISIATITLLGCQALGRLLVLALQNFTKQDFNHWYFVVGNLMNVIAFTMLWGTGGVTFELFVISSVFSGLSFGVTWACWPIGVYNHFPGKLKRVQTNMGVTFLAIFLGGLIITFMSEGMLHLKQGRDCNVVETTYNKTYKGSQCYEQVFAMFIILAMISTALSVVAAILIQRSLHKTSI
jgi:MFS family permease